MSESEANAERAAPPKAVIDLGDLGFDEGAHLLVQRALATRSRIAVRGAAPSLGVDLPAWCRARGHQVERVADAFASRWSKARVVCCLTALTHPAISQSVD